MNPLLLDDLFFKICDYLTLKQIVEYELISKQHHKMIRQHTWFHYLKIVRNDLLLILINRYTLKNLNLFFSDVTDDTVKLLNCNTLNLACTNVTDEGVKHCKCHDLILFGTKVTDEGVKHLKCHTLNLGGTNVTDEGVKHLTCHTLYLFNTKVTRETIQLLKSNGVNVIG